MCVDKDDTHRKGYINVTKFAKDFQSKNPDEHVKEIRKWYLLNES